MPAGAGDICLQLLASAVTCSPHTFAALQSHLAQVLISCACWCWACLPLAACISLVYALRHFGNSDPLCRSWMRGSWRSPAVAGGKAAGMMTSEHLSEVSSLFLLHSNGIASLTACLGVSCASCTLAVSQLSCSPAAAWLDMLPARSPVPLLLTVHLLLLQIR